MLNTPAPAGWAKLVDELTSTVIFVPTANAGRVRVSIRVVPHAVEAQRRRLSADELKARHADFLALIVQHPSLVDDPAAIAAQLGVHRGTIWRWIEAQRAAYLESQRNKRAQSEE